MRPLATFALPVLLAAQATPEPVVRLEGAKEVFRHGRVFLGGQPSLEVLRALKAQGVTLVVNLRGEKEVRDHGATAFQEEALVKELGMAYLALPLGEKGSYTPAALDRYEAARKAHPGSVLLHCASGGRATQVHMAHLVRFGGLSLDQAVGVGRQMAFSLPVEELLGAPATLQADAPLRVMTWNLRYDTPGDGQDAWPRRRETVLSTLRFHRVDLLCLQEGLAHQVAFLRERLGWTAVGVGRDDGRAAGEFAAILVDPAKATVQASGHFWLSPTPERPSKGWDASHPRIATWARLQDRQGRSFLVLNTHLDHAGAEARREGARLIARRLPDLAQGLPVILAGDLNAEEDAMGGCEPTRILAAAGLKDALPLSEQPHHGPRRTFPGFSVARAFEEGRLDYLLVSPGIRVRSHGTLTDFTDALRFPSDHLPLLAEVLLR